MVKILATPRGILYVPRQEFGGKYIVTNGVAWCPISQTRAA